MWMVYTSDSCRYVTGLAQFSNYTLKGLRTQGVARMQTTRGSTITCVFTIFNLRSQHVQAFIVHAYIVQLSINDLESKHQRDRTLRDSLPSSVVAVINFTVHMTVINFKEHISTQIQMELFHAWCVKLHI